MTHSAKSSEYKFPINILYLQEQIISYNKVYPSVKLDGGALGVRAGGSRRLQQTGFPAPAARARLWKRRRKSAGSPPPPHGHFPLARGGLHCHPLQRARTVGWLREGSVTLFPQKCWKARWAEKQMALEGSSLVEALPLSRCVALGKELAIGTPGYSATKQDWSGQL